MGRQIKQQISIFRMLAPNDAKSTKREKGRRMLIDKSRQADPAISTIADFAMGGCHEIVAPPSKAAEQDKRSGATIVVKPTGFLYAPVRIEEPEISGASILYFVYVDAAVAVKQAAPSDDHRHILVHVLG